MNRQKGQGLFRRNMCLLLLSEAMNAKLKGDRKAKQFMDEIEGQVFPAMRSSVRQKTRRYQKERRESWESVRSALQKKDLLHVAIYLQHIAYKYREEGKPERGVRFLRKHRPMVQDNNWNRKKLLAGLDRKIKALRRVIAQRTKSPAVNKRLIRSFLADEIAQKRAGCRQSDDFLRFVANKIDEVNNLYKHQVKWPRNNYKEQRQLIRLRERECDLLAVVELHEQLASICLDDAKPKQALRTLQTAREKVLHSDRYKKKILAEYDSSIAHNQNLAEAAKE